MKLDVDVAGRRIVVCGPQRAARRVVRRYTAALAEVTVVESQSDQAPADRDDLSRQPMPQADDHVTLSRLLAPAWLVVLVGLAGLTEQAVRDCAGRLGVPTISESPASDRGDVTLVGGGPGAPGLLTVAACDALRDADIVYYDRLAPSHELEVLASGAELVDVGKTPYHHRFTQTQITDLLIERARSGQSVVRLKGGDPFVFGRGTEELQACRAAGVAVRVVPGVTSAIAVPAAAGIPLTHRGISHSFTVISGHVPPTVAELAALADLARHGGTVVILMGVSNLPAITAGLRAAGLPDETPAAVVERGYSDSQRTTHSAVGQLVDDARTLDITAPAVIVIGDVTRLGTGPYSAVSGALPAAVSSAP